MNRAKHGSSVEIYSRFFDEFVTQKTGDKVVGHIMVDEMKLKSGIWFNSKDGSIIGFECNEGGVQIDNEIKKFIKGDKEGIRSTSVENDNEDEEKNSNSIDFVMYIN